jgi:hypothetical protein
MLSLSSVTGKARCDDFHLRSRSHWTKPGLEERKREHFGVLLSWFHNKSDPLSKNGMRLSLIKDLRIGRCNYYIMKFQCARCGPSLERLFLLQKKRQRHSGETSPQDEDFSYSQVDVADRMLRWEKPSGDRGWNLTNEKLIRDRYVS